jgi:hypothetical protein
LLKIRKLQNLGKFLFKTKCQWENEMKKITQNFEKEEEGLLQTERVIYTYRIHDI